MPIARPLLPSTVNVYPSGSSVPPVVLVDTVRLPVGGGGVEQSTENDTVAVCPAVTVTVREVPPLTLQFAAIPDRTTVWLPGESPSTVTLVLMPIARPVRQSTENDAVAVWPAVTVTVREVPPLTLQFAATSDRTTV